MQAHEKFKLIGGEAANVFKCGLAKIPNAAVRLQSASGCYFLTFKPTNHSQKKRRVKLLRIEIILSLSEWDAVSNLQEVSNR